MRLADLARHQDGVFSRRQARESGLSSQQVRRRVRSGTWTEIANRVYADRGLPMTAAAWRWAAMLSCGPKAVVSHRSAAQLWGMPVSVPPRPEISFPAHTRPGPRVKVHRVDVPPSDVQIVAGQKVTSRERTVADCLLVLSEPQGRTLLDRALQRGWVRPESLARRVQGAKGHHGAAKARRLMSSADPSTVSEAERVAQALLLAAGVTGWVSGHPLLVGGRVVAVLDVAFPAVLMAIEIDGWAWHSDPERFQDDQRRQNALVAAGWTVLRFTWADLIERPEQVVATVVRTLARLRS